MTNILFDVGFHFQLFNYEKGGPSAKLLVFQGPSEAKNLSFQNRLSIYLAFKTDKPNEA